MYQERIDKELAEFNHRLKEEPQNALLWVDYADFLLEQRNEPEKAISAYEVAKKLLPNSDMRLRIGEALVSAGKIDNAIDIINESLADNPRAHGFTILANAYLSNNEFLNAKQACLEALTLDPEDEEAFFFLGEATSEESSFEAIKYYKQALEQNPEFQLAWHALGRESIKEENYEEAIEALYKALSLNSEDGWSSLYLANALWRLGSNDIAELHYKAALSIFPKNAIVHKWYADFLKSQERNKEAESHERLWEDRN